jgi:hypothetical protein
MESTSYIDFLDDFSENGKKMDIIIGLTLTLMMRARSQFLGFNMTLTIIGKVICYSCRFMD